MTELMYNVDRGYILKEDDEILENQVIKSITLSRLHYLVENISLDITTCDILKVTEIPDEQFPVTKKFIYKYCNLVQSGKWLKRYFEVMRKRGEL